MQVLQWISYHLYQMKFAERDTRRNHLLFTLWLNNWKEFGRNIFILIMEKRSLEKHQCSKSNNLWQITYYFDLKSFPQISVRAFISVHGRDTCGNSGKRESADWGCSIELKAANSKQWLGNTKTTWIIRSWEGYMRQYSARA